MSEPSFDRRDLIRHMPELLAGKEPELLKPESRRFLLEDGECRALIHAAAETAIALDSGMSRMRRSARVVSPVLRRPMEQVKRHFARRMVDVFWDQAMAAYAEAAPGPDTFIENVHDRVWVKRTPQELRAVAERVSETLGVGDGDPTRTTVDQLITELGSQQGAICSLFLLLEGTHSLISGLDGVTVTIEQARGFADAPSEVDWIELAARVSGNHSRHLCLLEAARAEFGAGRVDHAAQLAQRSSALVPNNVTAMLATILYSVFANTPQRELDRLAQSALAAVGEPLMNTLSAIIRADRGDWIRVLARADLRSRVQPTELLEIVSKCIEEGG